MVALTGRAEAYYTDYNGNAAGVRGLRQVRVPVPGAVLHAGRGSGAGTPAHDLPPWAFVAFTQNHDQVANSGHGLRCQQMTSPGRYKATMALLLLGPSTPMLFQGQEFAATTPFNYFADHNPELSRLVNAGRLEFYKQFRSLAVPADGGGQHYEAQHHFDAHQPAAALRHALQVGRKQSQQEEGSRQSGGERHHSEHRLQAAGLYRRHQQRADNRTDAGERSQ